MTLSRYHIAGDVRPNTELIVRVLVIECCKLNAYLSLIHLLPGSLNDMEPFITV